MKQIAFDNNINVVGIMKKSSSSTDILDVFSCIVDEEKTVQVETKTTVNKNERNIFKASYFDTELGHMIAIGDDNALHFLQFFDNRGILDEVQRFKKRTNSIIYSGITDPIRSIEKEIMQYIQGTLIDKVFQTPIYIYGTDFQKNVWNQLVQIPYGETVSYGEIAKRINQPTSYRAVANANGANLLSIVIPCHRVINSNGDIGGYGGGISRKEWLLRHEKNV